MTIYRLISLLFISGIHSQYFWEAIMDRTHPAGNSLFTCSRGDLRGAGEGRGVNSGGKLISTLKTVACNLESRSQAHLKSDVCLSMETHSRTFLWITRKHDTGLPKTRCGDSCKRFASTLQTCCGYPLKMLRVLLKPNPLQVPLNPLRVPLNLLEYSRTSDGCRPNTPRYPLNMLGSTL